ncbi:MAG: hypothetical protein GC137_04115 [Alphaproteobacteria bacterium]|nr:hypothetical protein [Alphaproteobacteria bacterium]
MLLSEVQKRFKDSMFQPVDRVEQDAKNFADLFEIGDIALEDRLKVYHNNVIGSLSSYIVTSFPLLENLVGEDFLKVMARAFIFKNPPTSGCLHFYGEGFDDFIRNFEAAKSLPYLADVAMLELSINHAYYARDDEALTAEVLGKISEDTLGQQVIRLRESASLVSSKYPILELRDFCLQDGKGTPPDLSLEYKSRLLVFRPAFEVLFVNLTEDEIVFLGCMLRQKSLGESLEHVLRLYPDFDMAAFLQKHLSLGTFQAL